MARHSAQGVHGLPGETGQAVSDSFASVPLGAALPGAAEPWHTCRLDYSLTGTACGVGAVSGVGIVAVVGGVTPFLKGKSSSE